MRAKPIHGPTENWHLWGNPGCIHEHDDANQIAWNQEEGVACDCPEYDDGVESPPMKGDVAPDVDCYTLPDGSCVAPTCRLHDPLTSTKGDADA